MVKFLPQEEFDLLYPRGEYITLDEGKKIYLTENGKFVVKSEKASWRYIVTEIFLLNSISHPNIIEITNFTFENSIYSYAVPRGELIRNALREGKISLKTLISDMISATSFLHSNGIVHGDIKLDNIIFHENRAKLIDFGLSRRGYKIDGSYCFSGKCYTLTYRDPEFRSKNLNDINVELYTISALAYFYYFPDKNRSDFPGYFEFDFIEDDELRDLLDKLQSPLDWRASSMELARHPAIERERILPGRIITSDNLGDISISEIQGVKEKMEWLISIFEGGNVARPLFLAIKNFLRMSFTNEMEILPFAILSFWCYGDGCYLPVDREICKEAVKNIGPIIKFFDGKFFDYTQWDAINTYNQLQLSLSAFFRDDYKIEKFYVFPIIKRNHKMILHSYEPTPVGNLIEIPFSEGKSPREVLKLIPKKIPTAFSVKGYCKYILSRKGIKGLERGHFQMFNRILLELSEKYENYEMFNRIIGFS